LKGNNITEDDFKNFEKTIKGGGFNKLERKIKNLIQIAIKEINNLTRA